MNLIPDDYREKEGIINRLRNFAIIYSLILVCIVFLFYGLDSKSGQSDIAIEELREGKQLTLQKQVIYDTTQKQKDELERRLNILSGLRGGPPAEQMFIIFDQILDRDIWFTNWTFIRAGEIAEVEKKSVNTGYIIIIPRENNQKTEQAWRLNTHMEINGQARDHSKLSEFVTRLLKRPEIDDVKVVNTNLQQSNGSMAINFELVIVINNEYQVSR